MVLSNRENEVTVSQMSLPQTIIFEVYFEGVMGTKEKKPKGMAQYLLN